jgi:hypothetical protein
MARVNHLRKTRVCVYLHVNMNLNPNSFTHCTMRNRWCRWQIDLYKVLISFESNCTYSAQCKKGDNCASCIAAETDNRMSTDVVENQSNGGKIVFLLLGPIVFIEILTGMNDWNVCRCSGTGRQTRFLSVPSGYSYKHHCFACG